MHSEAVKSPRQIALQYFEMWNTGDSAEAAEILSPDWIDHAHPEVTGPHGVQQAIERVRMAQPDLRFDIHAVLGDGDLIAVVGNPTRGADASATAPRLIWLMRMHDGKLAEMWTYRDTTAS
ncbi:hypothetical protein GCM10023194_21440 [Planotetraspora phitsanulokensis]|uniref:SnoaL-like domain-containing protein n=1 Tax=Planotetraspora phitsanulokensis TaxID=575192 RepID=A0A8J3U708_9ACTN|nr:nuclear transport factor 2 family protein [Planotetraspora phitsanulokensis]GII38202.1 hypothetical protein Pph01_32050 [Planotetraspora phitsanulokensis]